jgi:transcriptional regulator with XRE-family HTH domain
MEVRGLRLYRLAAGLELKTLARQVGISRQLLARIEQGRSSPRLDVARRLAGRFETDVDTIFPEGSRSEPPARRRRVPVRAEVD